MIDEMKKKYYQTGAAIGAGIGTLALAAPVALAEGEQASATQTALTGLATSVSTEGQATVAAVLPVLAPLVAMIIVVGIGRKVIKMFSK